ncbi:MAG TPA: hypothetical protein VKC59_05020, partial [Candidatus Limnocylindrales bacterium]|nr:hypothetical protein [Candidatus Limnocylindrales bacterium]
TTLRRLPGFAIAAMALALSASLVFAAQPVSTGLANAASHSGQAVPLKGASDGVSSDEITEPDESTQTETETSTADNCTVDLTQDVTVLEGLNHGSVVCTAAQMPTPDGYDNHGAWVSHWAHLGKDSFNNAPNTHGKSSH